MTAIVCIVPNFQNLVLCEKDLKDSKHSSLHLGPKYARISVLRCQLFLAAHSFPRATISENCSLLGIDNARGKISWHIFAPNGGYCLFSPHSVDVIPIRPHSVDVIPLGPHNVEVIPIKTQIVDVITFRPHGVDVIPIAPHNVDVTPIGLQKCFCNTY